MEWRVNTDTLMDLSVGSLVTICIFVTHTPLRIEGVLITSHVIDKRRPIEHFRH